MINLLAFIAYFGRAFVADNGLNTFVSGMNPSKALHIRALNPQGIRFLHVFLDELLIAGEGIWLICEDWLEILWARWIQAKRAF